MTSGVLPQGFAELERFAPKWTVGTQAQRQRVRGGSTAEELRIFYDAMLPRLEEALDLADQYPRGEIPHDVEQLFFMTLSLAEVAPHVELYNGNPHVPYSFDESRFNAVHAREPD